VCRPFRTKTGMIETGIDIARHRIVFRLPDGISKEEYVRRMKELYNITVVEENAEQENEGQD